MARGKNSDEGLIWIDADPARRDAKQQQALEQLSAYDGPDDLSDLGGDGFTGPADIYVGTHVPAGPKPDFVSKLSNADQKPFDFTAFEALSFRDYQVGVVVEDKDPDPNDIRKLSVATRQGSWVSELSDSGEWMIDGQIGGEQFQRACNFCRGYHASDHVDLRDYQGPDIATSIGKI